MDVRGGRGRDGGVIAVFPRLQFCHISVWSHKLAACQETAPGVSLSLTECHTQLRANIAIFNFVNCQ